MRIPLTVPLKTDDGREFSEVYVVAEIFVTVPPSPPTWNSPADGPEWEVDKVYLELGTWVGKNQKKPIFVSEVTDLPDYLEKPVMEYIMSKAGQTEIATQIQDASQEEW